MICVKGHLNRKKKFKSLPIFKSNLNQRCILQRLYTYKTEYLCKFKTEFENILQCKSGAYMGPIHEKNQRSTISCYCTF